MADRLFAQVLDCCVCHRTRPAGKKSVPAGEPNFIAITPILWRKGGGKGQLRNAPRVQVCEPCYIEACTTGRLGWMNNASKRLWAAIQQSLLDRYSAMRKED